jgi:Flp pilus assembly protein CpaB
MLLIISLLIGFFGFIMALNIIKSNSKPSFQYVVAKQNIGAHQVIDESQLTLSQPLKNQNFNELFTSPVDVAGQMTTEKITAGNLVYRTQVEKYVPPTVESAEPEKPTKLEVPAGKRAFGVPAASVDGFPEGLTIGDYVDIFGIMPGPSGKNELQSLIQSAQVLSIQAKESGEILKITLALSPEAVDLLTRASANGKMRLVPGIEQEEVITYNAGEYTEIIRGVSHSKNALDSPAGQSAPGSTLTSNPNYPPGTGPAIPSVGAGVASAEYRATAMAATQQAGDPGQ